MTPHTHPRRRRLRRHLTGLAVVVGLVALNATPASAQSFPFGTAYERYYPAAGTTPRIAIMGDSLVNQLWPSDNGAQILALRVRDQTGRSTDVSAMNGASWVNYGVAAQVKDNDLAWVMADNLNARLTIMALGTNDATISTLYPAYYTPAAQNLYMYNTVNAIRTHSSCVLLVNVKRRGTSVPNLNQSIATAINNNMWVLSSTYPGGRVFLANWDSWATGHPEWFQTGDVHLTEAGSTAYSDFIELRAQQLIDNENC